MPYRKNLNQVELTVAEFNEIVKKWAKEDAKSSDELDTPTSFNQMAVEFRDGAGNIIRPIWVRVQW